MTTKYEPGYAMHQTQARLAGSSPWGWREAVVRDSGNGSHHLDYVLEDGSIRVWSAFLPYVQPGTPVLMHERYRVLECEGRWFNVRQDTPGLGPVPEPVEPGLWVTEMRPGIVDIARGTGVTTADSGDPHSQS